MHVPKNIRNPSAMDTMIPAPTRASGEGTAE